MQRLAFVRSRRASWGLVLAATWSLPAAAQAPQTPQTPWRTDTTRKIIALADLSGTGQRDGIPSLTYPAFETIAGASEWLKDREPVAVVTRDGAARAYPIQILMYHDVVNDSMGGVPIAVTFCILCQSAVAYDRRFDGKVLDFGYAGYLHNSNLVIYDRQTETWWGQIVGQGLVGSYAGRKLTRLSAPVMSFAEFKRYAPEGVVLSRKTGYDRPYGTNRLAGYDEQPNPIARIFRKDVDVRLPAKERVLVIERGDDIAAAPFSLLAKERVVTAEVGGHPVVMFWAPGTASIYAANTAEGKDVGAAIGYDPRVDGRTLHFRAMEEGFEDRETGSQWTLAGQAVSGPLAGKALTAVDDGVHLWFAWAAYRPTTRVVTK